MLGQKLVVEMVEAKVQPTVDWLAVLSAVWTAAMMVGSKAELLAVSRVGSKVPWRVVMMVAMTAYS